jgi:hypothetical protein
LVVSNKLLLDSKEKMKKYTIVLININDYVQYCENIKSIDVVNILNKCYFSIIHDITIRNKGELDLIMGDRQYIMWNKKNEKENAINACKSTIDIYKNHIQMMMKIDEEKRYNISIAICTGEVDEIKNNIIGNIVDYSSKLISIGKEKNIPILIDEETKNLVQSLYECEIIPNMNEKNNIYSLIM